VTEVSSSPNDATASLSRIVRSTATGVLKALVQTYRLTFALILPRSCRYAPSCSEYALEALEVHGPMSGAWLTVRRLARCHPWGGSGYDPVPGTDADHDHRCGHPHHGAQPSTAPHR